MSLIPYVDLAVEHQSICERLCDIAHRVISSGRFILGQAVEEFEASLAERHNLPHAVGVASGVDALQLTLEALGVGPGDEVITVPNSFVATAAAIARVGARIIFVDVDAYQTMNPDELGKAISPRTKAIVPVHLTGRPAPMNAILRLAEAAGVVVIEDCAQAIGARLGGRPVGSFGIAGCYSFHPVKNLGACGDAGAVVTADSALAARLRLLRNHGLSDRDTCSIWGHNSRLDAIQASILQVKLAFLDEWIEMRRRNAKRYFDHLFGLDLYLPHERPGEYSVWHSFVIQTPRRNALREFLRDRGIECLIHYPVPIHLQPAASNLGYGPRSFPICEAQAQSILSLPIRHSLSESDIGTIANGIREFFTNSPS